MSQNNAAQDHAKVRKNTAPKSRLLSLSTFELILWTASVLVTSAAFFIFDRRSWMNLAVSVTGVTSLAFCSKGNPAGQVLIIAFSALYGIISFVQHYYGEMITYLGMTAPMAVASLISWLRHPHNGNRSQVSVNRLKPFDFVLLPLLTAAVTAAFYFILKAFNTADLAVSTVSVATSFAAVYLTFRRSALYAIVYAANDAVLVTLWLLAASRQMQYYSVAVCFAAFLANDIYGFINWRRMEKKQAAENAACKSA